ncbi:hypothetical protein [Psychrobacillus sp. FSL H8-0487]|uniref:hypothetical protein n=1 Tax=Psychrobacillus sp. FSL H8-0487 TaxID=2921391 RepID=UPI0030F5DCB2
MFDFMTLLLIKLSELTNYEVLIIILLLLLFGAGVLYLFLLVERFSAGGPSNKVLRKALHEVGVNKSFRVDEKGEIKDLTIVQNENRDK